MTDDVKTIRAPRTKDRPYFSMARATAQDNTLTWEARGVLAYLLSKPDDWQVMIKDLQQNCGRDKARTILKELQDHKYLSVEQVHDAKGKFSRNQYRVFETPFTENPSTVYPSTGNPPLTDNREAQTIELEKDTAPDGDLPPKKSKAELDAEFECIAEVWGNRAGGWVSSMQGMIFGSKKVKGEWRDCQFEPPATIDEVKAFGVYARKRSLDGAMVTTAATIQRWFYDFRNGKQKISPTPDDPDYDPRMDLSIPVPFDPADIFKGKPYSPREDDES